MATTTAERAAHVNLWLPPQHRQELLERARANERSLSGEIRVAIREHLERDNGEDDEP